MKTESGTSWDIPLDATSPSGCAMAQEASDQLRRALACLPEDYRTVILLHQRRALAFDEVGRRMGRSTDAARKLWFRALKELRCWLGDADELP